ncbi:MAG: DUF1549 domain-containing protein, partial [Planctomycetota bacterium]
MLPTLTLLALAPAAASVAFEPGSEFEAARAVLESRCLPCHGGDRRESGLSFADAATFAAGGSRGVAIEGDDLPASRLIEVTSYRNPDLAMPPSGVLPAEERAALEAWVLAGAPWPEGEVGRLADPESHPLHEDEVAAVDETWWAYEPLVAPDVPPAAQGSAHPIDAFVAARLAAAGLEPAEHARPDALLRRATFDLTGLPPTASDREAFERDVEQRGFDAAWSALLDRLFASPHYGEQQARHWLDLVRYAETNGYERDTKKENVWRYRDWVVRAFDADLPYDRFVALQLAGDELALA